jgi:hypothetical protein
MTQRDAEKLLKKQEAAARDEAKRLEKLAKGRIAPLDMFKVGEHENKFSKFDEQVRPRRRLDRRWELND